MLCDLKPRYEVCAVSQGDSQLILAARVLDLSVRRIVAARYYGEWEALDLWSIRENNAVIPSSMHECWPHEAVEEWVLSFGTNPLQATMVALDLKAQIEPVFESFKRFSLMPGEPRAGFAARWEAYRK